MDTADLLSWLRDTKKCQTVQKNWKPSTVSWNINNDVKIHRMIEKLNSYFFKKYKLSLFKSQQSYTTLIRQGEIGLLGIAIKKGVVSNIYSINFSNNKDGLEKVLGDLIVTSMMLYGYFGVDKGQVIIVLSPNSQKEHNQLKHYIEVLNKLYIRLGLRFKCQIFDDERLKETAVNPANPSTIESTSQQTKAERSIKTKATSVHVERKIGVLVRNSITRLIKENKLTTETVSFLCDEKYCKNTFDINYPFFKRVQRGIPMTDQRKINGYDRYWKNYIVINNEKFLVCNDWYERNRTKFVIWLGQYL
ncbi:hypothetical protein EJF36_12400 [Bacillus sp. HMF5848]|uniref:hypothetical protein n=1 Tax=Bacillus sp. HMF5848 TaxID=2495421 RepID=UPI000F7B26C5|nr:hypothetical protein [Bacillus sp. HMF5848]RSK27612.1 hypothetical protein EJF36_12400 [Bacillus sp. HMF5848]